MPLDVLNTLLKIMGYTEVKFMSFFWIFQKGCESFSTLNIIAIFIAVFMADKCKQIGVLFFACV